MFKGTITSATALTSGANVPFTVSANTNSNTAYDPTTNSVSIKRPGYYNVLAELDATVSATANSTIQLYAGGSLLAETLRTHGFIADATQTPLATSTVIHVTPNNLASYANISVQTTNVTSADSGVFIVEKVR